MTHHTDGEEQADFVSRPDVLGGTLCFLGTRIPVGAVVRLHEDGYSIAHILSEYPSLTREQVSLAIGFRHHIPQPVEAAPHGKQTKQKTKDDAQGA